VLGPVILAASRSDQMRRLISAAPVTKQVVDRFIPGETVDEIVPIVQDLTAKGLEVTMDVVGEDITTPEQAAAARDAYLELVDRLKELELGTRAEMSIKLSMFGQALDGGHELALANVRPVVEAAAAIGTTVTLDAEDHTTLDSMFAIHEELRKDFPQTGCVIQAYLFRTEADARRLAEAGSRVRLVKGAYKEPAEVAYQQKARGRTYAALARAVVRRPRRDLPARRRPAGRPVARGRSTPPPCSASRRPPRPPGRDRRRLRADRLLALQRQVRPRPARRAAAGELARASGTGPTTARSRASSTRSRRSTSPRSPATCRPRRR
jgi:hypothetical protein